MAKIQCRNFPDDLFEQLNEEAQKNERSLEGHVRFLLSNYLVLKSVNEQLDIPEWMDYELQQSAKRGFRSFRFEIIKRLTESLENEGITPPDD